MGFWLQVIDWRRGNFDGLHLGCLVLPTLPGCFALILDLERIDVAPLANRPPSKVSQIRRGFSIFCLPKIRPEIYSHDGNRENHAKVTCTPAFWYPSIHPSGATLTPRTPCRCIETQKKSAKLVESKSSVLRVGTHLFMMLAVPCALVHHRSGHT